MGLKDDMETLGAMIDAGKAEEYNRGLLSFKEIQEIKSRRDGQRLVEANAADRAWHEGRQGSLTRKP